MGRGKGLIYLLGQLLGRHILWATQRMHLIRPRMVEQEGPFIIALTHLSHLEPIIVSVLVRRRPIDWLSRVEFFRYAPVRALLNAIGAICVRRQGVSANGIRQAIDRLGDGRIVGVCPEGGVTRGADSIMRGGALKQGVCLISLRTGVPVLPCIMLGTHRLNRVPPWIPFRRSTLFVAFGSSLVHPPQLKEKPSRVERRAAREAMARELSLQFQALLKETTQTFNVPDSFLP